MSLQFDKIPDEFLEYWETRRQRIDGALGCRFSGSDTCLAKVADAVRYTLLAPGKRVRGLVVLAANEALQGPEEPALGLACVVEMVHAASLIIDDLPSMDNATMRRGKPTLHCVAGEPLAILAAFALLNDSYRLIQQIDGLCDASRRAIALSLTASVGEQGLIGGQSADLDTSHRGLTAEALEAVHRDKTAALFRFAVEAAGLAANALPPVLEGLYDYARNLGMAYQIADDLLSTRSTEETGKDVDDDREKITFTKIFGVEGAIRRTHDLVHAAIESLGHVGLPEERLGAIAGYVLACSLGETMPTPYEMRMVAAPSRRGMMHGTPR